MQLDASFAAYDRTAFVGVLSCAPVIAVSVANVVVSVIVAA
jgi:hypothetical protein